MNIMNAIKDESANTNLTMTENGAFGFTNHKSNLVDFFYKISSMRNWDAASKYDAFLKAKADDKDLAFRMLFYARDIRKGLGERKLFREILRNLDDDTIIRLIPLVPEFGRWDDIIDMIGGNSSDKVKTAIANFVHDQILKDISAANSGKPVSLLAKWLPSIRKVSKDKIRIAKILVSIFGIKEREYRKMLSFLRGKIRVVEKAMSANEWASIDFGSVPSKAAKNYRQAFSRHDGERYGKYLEGLKNGTEKINAGAIFPYEIVSSYIKGHYYSGRTIETDDTLEAQWKALPLPDGGILKNAIVVRDGSGSMQSAVSGQSTALDVASSLAILTSEHLEGPYKNKFISFSERPRFIDLSGCDTLREKIIVTYGEDECANTNIERTMKLILDAAVKNGIPQEEIPAVVIISDMEFDEARGCYRWNANGQDDSRDTLFSKIGQMWEDKGYSLPKIVFWNVNSRTGAVPMQENKNGLLLISGFSQNILDLLSMGGDMSDIIARKLSDKRYDCVTEALK